MLLDGYCPKVSHKLTVAQGDEAGIVDYRAGSPFACFAGTVYVHDFTCYALRQQQFFSTRRARALGVRGRNIRGRISLR